MSENIFTPGPSPDIIPTADGRILHVPESSVLLPPGDAAMFRRVKSRWRPLGCSRKKWSKIASQDIWAPAATIDQIRAKLETERSIEWCAKRKDSDALRREKAQSEHVENF